LGLIELRAYARRASIWQAHVDYTKASFYFLAHDARVPKPLHEEREPLGLRQRRIRRHKQRPHQLYVREHGAWLGEFVATQKDVQDGI